MVSTPIYRCPTCKASTLKPQECATCRMAKEWLRIWKRERVKREPKT